MLTGVIMWDGLPGAAVVVVDAALYLEMILLNACPSVFHENTLTSFSMLRGLGFPKDMITLKNSSLSALALLTVSGWNPSRFLRIRFFSSTLNRLGAASSCSRRWIVSTDVT